MVVFVSDYNLKSSIKAPNKNNSDEFSHLIVNKIEGQLHSQQIKKH